MVKKGLIVLGGSVDDASSQSHIQPFAEKDQISFPLLVGTTTEQMKQLHLGKQFQPPPSLTLTESWWPEF
jgi:hypothetical protein